MRKYCIPAILFFYFLTCKEVVRDSSTLTDDTASDNKTVEVPAKTCCDTIIIERDTTAIDVKESEVAPEIIKAAKPVYSMDMIDNEVAGTVRLKLLVGTDGLVKEYVIFNDLGHGTNDAIHTALTKMRFTAARKNKKRISVWIETTLYFKLPKI